VDQFDLERARAAYGTLRSDMTPNPQLFHPDVEWHNVPELPGAGVHRGIDAMMADIRAQAEAWDDRRFEPVEVVTTPNGAVVRVEVTAQGRSSGAPVRLEVFHVLTFRDGKVARVQAFLDRDTALRAGGAGAD
jgi:ketosteroid isomerase-like protein